MDFALILTCKRNIHELSHASDQLVLLEPGNQTAEAISLHLLTVRHTAFSWFGGAGVLEELALGDGVLVHGHDDVVVPDIVVTRDSVVPQFATG